MALDQQRAQVVKAMLDEFPELRSFVRGYLKTYYPKEEGKTK